SIESGASANIESPRSSRSIDDFDLVIEATLLLAEAYFRRGKDDLGRKRLADVARYRAGLELPPERYPPLFLNVWREVRAEELARTRGSLVIEGPAGGRVTLNGRSLGEAPLRITELVPGAHHVVVRRNGLAWARTVALAEGREAKASGGSGGSTDEFTEDMQTGAQAQGRDAAATLVVVSAVASTGNGYQVETFVGAVASGEFQRLDTVELGRSLIGTSLETKSIARRLENLRGGLENTLSGAVPFMGNRAVIAAAPGPMSSVAYQEPARAAVDLEPVPAVDAVRPPDPLNPRSQPYVDLEVRDDSSIVDAWWFWPAVGVLAAGAATATYFAFIRDDSVDGVSLEAVW
ncbi:MAG: PEGA domain-containing protein, partial [Myxococcota bacterium]